MVRPETTTTDWQLRRRRRHAFSTPLASPPPQTCLVWSAPSSERPCTHAKGKWSHAQVEFKPLVQLDEVKTASGEEEEESVFKM